MVSIQDVAAVRAATAYCSNGDKIGRVGDVYVDDLSGEPAWVTISTGFFGSRTLFAPLAGARLDGDRLVLGYTKDAIGAAPSVADSGHISDVEQQQLFDYYQGVAPVGDGRPDPVVDGGDQHLVDRREDVVTERRDDDVVLDRRDPDLADRRDADLVDRSDDVRGVPADVDADGRLGGDLDRASALLAGAGAAGAAAATQGAGPTGTSAVAAPLAADALTADGRPLAGGPAEDERRPDDPQVLDATDDGATLAPVPVVTPDPATVATDPPIDHSAERRDDPAARPVGGSVWDTPARDDRAAERAAGHDVAAEDAEAGYVRQDGPADDLGADRGERLDTPLSGVAARPADGDTAAQSAHSGRYRMHPGHTRETIYRDTDGNIIYSVVHTFEQVFGGDEGRPARG